MRYFVYISKSKVEMLYSQLPEHSSGERSYEVGFDLKFFKALFKKSLTQKDLIRKAEAVCEWLESEGQIGDVENPQQFFRGSLPMAWGPFIDQFNVEGKHLLLFVGEDYFPNGNFTICLGGSLNNIVGAPQNPELEKKGGFSTHYLIRKILADGINNVAGEPQDKYDEDEMLVRAIESLPILIDINGKKHRDYLSFVAKTLFVKEKANKNGLVILGTPIFVEEA